MGNLVTGWFGQREFDIAHWTSQHRTFYSADRGGVSVIPVVSPVFGIGRFDLTTRQVNFTPIGPAPDGMAGLQVAPDKKNAYTVITNGIHGNKRCEFWAFDLATNHIAQTTEVACRSRFSFGMAGNGKKLYFYGAGFEIEVYDAVSLKYERTWDLNNDVTGAGMIVIN